MKPINIYYNKQMTVSIIGFSGKGFFLDEKYVAGDLFDRMKKECINQIDDWKLQKEEIVLVSGGCSFADHVAVALYLEGGWKGLELYLPCDFDCFSSKFKDSGDNKWYNNPGKTLNSYHAKFSKMVCINSLDQLSTCIEKGATVTVSKGFHARNTHVAKSEYMIAITLTQTIMGGTSDTWKKAKNAIKAHIQLK